MRSLGLFCVARALTGQGVRILGYHGISLDDETKFVPGLFIDPKVFEQRLEYLAKRNFPVLALGDAMERMKNGTLPDGATVITFDDGFYSVYRHAVEPLHRHGFPSTLYLTTYYFDKQTPFFDLSIDYICWKSTAASVDLSQVRVPALKGLNDVPLTQARRKNIATTVKEYAKAHCDEPTRCRIAGQLGEAFGVDYAVLVESRALNTIDAGELREMLRTGMDIQLHTHRHNLPKDTQKAIAELDENRQSIERVSDITPRHFCYPSGEWSPEHWAALESYGIESGVTCEAKLVYPETPKFALNRILDSARISQIEFEAEMSGFTELTRIIRERAAWPTLVPAGWQDRLAPGLRSFVESFAGRRLVATASVVIALGSIALLQPWAPSSGPQEIARLAALAPDSAVLLELPPNDKANHGTPIKRAALVTSG